MGNSDKTEPLESYDDDVFAADLEDPVKKYAQMTKKAVPTKVAASIPEEEEYLPPPFLGSKVFWFGLVWVALVVVIIVVSVVSTRDDDPSPTMAPTLESINATEIPQDTDVPNTTAPSGVANLTSPTSAPSLADATSPTAAPSLANATSPTAAPSVANITSPTAAPSVANTTSPTAAPSVANTTTPTAAPSVANTTTPTAAPSVVANATTPTAAPSVVANITLPPSSVGNATDRPTSVTDYLPNYTVAAIENPLSPQAFANRFVNYDPNVTSRSPEELVQRFALATQFFALGGRDWTAGSLLPTAPECEWFEPTGSTCNDLGQQETLMLEKNNLKNGPIPPEIGLLTALKVVDMSDNFIVGEIPTYFGQLQELEVLRLARNSQMTGTIPTELASIPNLRVLVLSGLALNGTIPDGLCDIPTLTFDCSADLCGCDACPCAST